MSAGNRGPRAVVVARRDAPARATRRPPVSPRHRPPAHPHAPRSKLRYLVSLHPSTAIATLSAHAARRVSARLNGAHVHWMLPAAPGGCDAGCAEGFAVQGK